MVVSRRLFLLFGIAYLAFVVYGSLVPFDFRARSLDAALAEFERIRYLRLGIESRADWVANILLYIPLPFLLLSAVNWENRRFRQAVFSVLIFFFCVALSLSIEFAQLYFPPRTVSLNDIIAEIFGAVIGSILWWTSGRRVGRLVDSLFSQGKSAVYAGLALYSIVYLAFSLFPYDFLVSGEEIRNKLTSDYFSWLPSRTACGGTLRCGAKLVAEGVSVAPLGLLIALVSSRQGWRLVRSAGLMGFGLGLAIEALQFFLVSGFTLGASVFTRLAGVAAGAALGESLKGTSTWPLLYLLRPFIPIAGALYLCLLAAVGWMGKGRLLTFEEGVKRLDGIRFMPFYYHYYTTESAAMASLLAAAIMFVPIGVLYWVWRVTQLRGFAVRGMIKAGLIGGAVSAALELGKLFFNGARPDPTNVLIGLLAAAAGFGGATIGTRASLDLWESDGSGD